MDSNKGEWKQGKEVGRARVVRKGRKLYLNNNLKKSFETIKLSIVKH